MQYDDEVITHCFIGGKEITLLWWFNWCIFFLDEFEREAPKDNCFQALELALHATPARW